MRIILIELSEGTPCVALWFDLISYCISAVVLCTTWSWTTENKQASFPAVFRLPGSSDMARYPHVGKMAYRDCRKCCWCN